MIDAILFDKDGTLFDFAATWEAWAEAFLLRAMQGDRARAEALGQVIGFDLGARRFARDSVVIAGTPGQIVEALSPHMPGMGATDLLRMLNEEAEAAPQAQAVPLAPLLDGLRARGLSLGVMTNDTEAVARAHLGEAGVTDRFAFIAGFDSGHGAKPSPAPLLAFCAAVGVAPSRALMVGDSTHDLLAGRAAGMRTVGVLTGLAGPDVLAPHADAILPDIGHIPDWLTRNQENAHV